MREPRTSFDDATYSALWLFLLNQGINFESTEVKNVGLLLVQFFRLCQVMVRLGYIRLD